MDNSASQVLIIGGGIAGLTAADELSALGIPALIVEKTDFLGGQAIRFACKATDICQKCSACLVEERLKEVSENPGIRIMVRSELRSLTQKDRYFHAVIERHPVFVDPQKCNNCGICLRVCPAGTEGAIRQAYSIHNRPGYAIDPSKCLHFEGGGDCRKCVEVCPNQAIRLDAAGEQSGEQFDAMIVASGFTPFDPASKPQFSYGIYSNVISALELEHILRCEGRAIRPSDRKEPRKIAFIQCVGSRERRYPFCSRVCCAYALRMAKAIKKRQPEVELTVFYIDIQTFGKDFLKFYKDVQTRVRMVRMIPGDTIQTEENRLRLSYMDDETHETVDEIFDLVVLSVGIRPSSENRNLANLLQLDLADDGFFSAHDHTDGARTSREGIFLAGTVRSPMDIADTIAQAGQAAWEVAKYLHNRT